MAETCCWRALWKFFVYWKLYLFYTFFRYNYTLLYPFIPENKKQDDCPWLISPRQKKIINRKQAYPRNYTLWVDQVFKKIDLLLDLREDLTCALNPKG